MEKIKTWKSVVLWSVISAAFIGPGTVTTAVSAGSLFKLDLLWAVTFATVACILLQEVAARITIASGMNMGQILTKRFGNKKGRVIQGLIGGIVIAGCAAYESGNILGAVSGLNLLSGVDVRWLTVLICTIVFLLLWKGSPSWISNLMMVLIVIMGIAFLRVAFVQDFSLVQVARSSIAPVFPAEGELLLLGLIGTTIVPYNIFLGSGVSKGQTVPMMRLGLTISVFIGGMITAAILIAGTAINDFSSFAGMYEVFENKIGRWASVAIALGLFAAGFSSAVTSPYAASVISRSVLGMKKENHVRAVWISVLMTGFGMGISGLKPIPVILLVQALNGLILPLLIIFLILVVNDTTLIPSRFRHGHAHNVLLMVVLASVLVISLNNVDKIILSAFNLQPQGHFLGVILLALIILSTVAILVFGKNLRKV